MSYVNKPICVPRCALSANPVKKWEGGSATWQAVSFQS